MFGVNADDVVSALRLGGSLDRFGYITACMTCGASAVERFGWFAVRDFMCFCGGHFDVAPLSLYLGDLKGGRFAAATKNPALFVTEGGQEEG